MQVSITAQHGSNYRYKFKWQCIHHINITAGATHSGKKKFIMMCKYHCTCPETFSSAQPKAFFFCFFLPKATFWCINADMLYIKAGHSIMDMCGLMLWISMASDQSRLNHTVISANVTHTTLILTSKHAIKAGIYIDLNITFQELPECHSKEKEASHKVQASIITSNVLYISQFCMLSVVTPLSAPVWVIGQTMRLRAFWLEHIVGLWVTLSPPSWWGDADWRARKQKVHTRKKKKKKRKKWFIQNFACKRLSKQWCIVSLSHILLKHLVVKKLVEIQ